MSLLAVVMLMLLAPAASHAKVEVVTTTPTQADLVRVVGGEHVTVESLMRGPENPHNVLAKPSFIVKLRKADLFVHTGLDAEPWVPVLLKSARKAELLPGGVGNVDVSRGIVLKEVPKRGELSRAQGDIHVYGNTHYVLDPVNGITMAQTIAEALKGADPLHAAVFDANAAAFATRIHALVDRLLERLKPYGEIPVVTYHRAWPYFLDRFRLRSIAEVEPKPGIAPGAKHIAECVERMQAHGAKIVILATFSDEKSGELVARRAGGEAVVLAQEVDALPGVDSYEELFEYNIEALLSAQRRQAD